MTHTTTAISHTYLLMHCYLHNSGELTAAHVTSWLLLAAQSIPVTRCPCCNKSQNKHEEHQSYLILSHVPKSDTSHHSTHDTPAPYTPSTNLPLPSLLNHLGSSRIQNTPQIIRYSRRGSSDLTCFLRVYTIHYSTKNTTHSQLSNTWYTTYITEYSLHLPLSALLGVDVNLIVIRRDRKLWMSKK